jgi:hypothetical protein
MPSSEHALPAQAGGQLNPDWVEWLMGWPVGWTSPDPLPLAMFREWQTANGIEWTASAPLATDKSASPPHTPFRSFQEWETVNKQMLRSLLNETI